MEKELELELKELKKEAKSYNFYKNGLYSEKVLESHKNENGDLIEVRLGQYGRSYYKNGKLHREDGPAVEDFDGRKVWCKDGKDHRIDGAAMEFPGGRREYYYEGKHICSNNEAKFNRLMNLRLFW
jgi:hypothetical protein